MSASSPCGGGWLLTAARCSALRPAVSCSRCCSARGPRLWECGRVGSYYHLFSFLRRKINFTKCCCCEAPGLLDRVSESRKNWQRYEVESIFSSYLGMTYLKKVISQLFANNKQMIIWSHAAAARPKGRHFQSGLLFFTFILPWYSHFSLLKHKLMSTGNSTTLLKGPEYRKGSLPKFNWLLISSTNI